LLTNNSEEGIGKGLGYINASAKKFSFTVKKMKVLNFGWNSVLLLKHNLLTLRLNNESKFYFVHSYCVEVENKDDSLLKTEYGVNFDTSINYENIYVVQFHPEKSYKFGVQLLKNF
jgi:imidazole glycerol-phosphate synthase subunit HisH